MQYYMQLECKLHSNSQLIYAASRSGFSKMPSFKYRIYKINLMSYI